MHKTSWYPMLRKNSASSTDGVDNRRGPAIAIDVPAAKVYCQVGLSKEKGGNEDLADHCCVPEIVQEESEGKEQQQHGSVVNIQHAANKYVVNMNDKGLII